jgi:hypothetical protein
MHEARRAVAASSPKIFHLNLNFNFTDFRCGTVLRKEKGKKLYIPPLGFTISRFLREIKMKNLEPFKKERKQF